MKKVLAVGCLPDVEKEHFTGQAIMFSGFVEYMKTNSCDVTVVNIASRFNTLSNIIRAAEYFYILGLVLFYILTRKFDVAYVSVSQSRRGFLRDYLMYKMLKLAKVKMVAHYFGASYKAFLDSLDEKEKGKLNRMLSYISEIIVEGDYMKGLFSFLGDDISKVNVIPNGLPNEGKNALQAKVIDPQKPFLLFYLSNLIYSKGFYDVLEAVDILKNKKNKNIECVFAGAFIPSSDDPKDKKVGSKEEFDNYVEAHNLSDVVTYYPGLYSDAKDQMFVKANVFLLPTYFIAEGQPVSIIEAMSYGCVPIVTKYRHIPMMINENNGCFVSPQKPENIADTIEFLIDNTKEYELKSFACIKDYKDYFTFEVFASKVYECINKAVNS